MSLGALPAQMPRGNWTGATPFWSCQADPRFSYCLYVPSQADEATRLPLFVCIHGSYRVAESYRDHLWRFAEELGCILLCPLFPCGADGANDTESYKFVYWPSIRYDEVLLAMIGEVERQVPIDASRFVLFGYSGGGQFAHRFFYGHSDRLLGLSIGAPGVVTLLDHSRPWWVGTEGLDSIVGPVDLASMRKVPVQMVVGDADLDPIEIVSRPSSPHRMEGVDDSGRDRIARLAALEDNFRRNGVAVEKVLVPGVGHDGFAVLEPVKDFVRRVLVQDTPEQGLA